MCNNYDLSSSVFSFFWLQIPKTKPDLEGERIYENLPVCIHQVDSINKFKASNILDSQVDSKCDKACE
jgi:hypothetical protein